MSSFFDWSESRFRTKSKLMWHTDATLKKDAKTFAFMLKTHKLHFAQSTHSIKNGCLFWLCPTQAYFGRSYERTSNYWVAAWSDTKNISCFCERQNVWLTSTNCPKMDIQWWVMTRFQYKDSLATMASASLMDHTVWPVIDLRDCCVPPNLVCVVS